MKKHLLLILGSASFALLTACATLSPTTTPKTSLWEVSSAQRVIYIASDTEVLSASDYPLPAQFAAAFSESGSLYVEQIPPASKENQESLHSDMVKFALLPGDETLQDLLTPAQLATVQAAMQTAGLPYSHFQRLQPWLVALILMSDPANHAILGIKPQEQLTRRFYLDAKTRNVPVTPFESYAKTFQIGSSMPREVQVEWLLHVSKPDDDKQDKHAKIRELVKAWRMGDTAAVAALSGSFKVFPKVREALVVQRNQTWVRILEDKLGTKGEPVFVVVGDGHLMGQESMLSLLREAGYRVRQL